REKLMLLGDVERYAAQAVVPLLDKYGLAARDNEVLRDMGQVDARATVVNWDMLLAGMRQTYPGYLKSFEKLEAMAPEEDRALLSFLTEHEIAAIKFLDIEALDPSESAQPLRSYLATDPAHWNAGVE
ncbi:MAG: hypothetical protein AAFW87_01760, partial [Pseudomonadota bacterium]